MSKKKHEESHGGAWKVAYADFVTAMMALFMVLWISAQQKEILIATSKYFQNPFTSPLPASSGVMEGKKELTIKDENAERTRIFTPEMYQELAQQFLKLLDIPKDNPDTPIELKVADDGIKIILYDRPKQPVFKAGTTELTTWGDYVSQNLAWVIDRFHMRVKIESYVSAPDASPAAVSVAARKDLLAADKGVDSALRPPDPSHDTWDLTSDQANVIRHRLNHYGLEASMFDRVTGYGSGYPKQGLAPADPSNNRIEITLMATTDTPAPVLKE